MIKIKVTAFFKNPFGDDLVSCELEQLLKSYDPEAIPYFISKAAACCLAKPEKIIIEIVEG